MFRARRVNAYYTGPVSDHFDGVRFFNRSGLAPKSFAAVAQLYVNESWARWPKQFPSPHQPDRPPPEVTGEAARIVHVGHASWLVQTGGRNVLIDPVWVDRAGPLQLIGPRRVNAPGIAFEDLPRIDVVLVTHNHYDHMDLETLGRLWQRFRPKIVTPLGNDTIIRSAISDLEARTVDWGDAVDLGGGLVVDTVPTQHWSARGVADRSHALWASFVIATPAGKIYAIGDSGLGDRSTFRHVAERHPSLRLALMPIGAYEPRWFMGSQHMNPEDAVEAFLISGAREALGHHWGTFQLTAEAIEQPPLDLAAALEKRKIAPDRFR
ncbi:MAG: MBL fold metallo-hydrolase, partial [Proteobacteria bacterium]|nr:MBL fold metallo-hydrolase [Pseudomonadota bacterium]